MGLLFNPLNGELEMGQVASQVPFDNTIFDSYGVTPATQVQEAVDSLITAMATTFGDLYAYIPTDHDQLSGLADDDHTQYALLAGRSGGQTLSGSSVEDEHLTLKANAAAFNTFTNTGRIKITDQIQNDGGFTISHNNSGFFNEWYYYGHRHTGTITVQSGGNAGTYASVYNDATIVWSGAQILSSIQLFDARPTLEPTISSNVTDTTTNYRMFFALPTLKPNISTASTWTGVAYGGYVAAPSIGVKTGSHASAAVVMPRMYGYASVGVAVGAQTTVTDLSHNWVQNATNAGTITRQIGLDIEALTSGTTDIGIRLAKADTYTIQLSDTGGTAAGGITFGTDTNLYRSATNTLKTDDNFTSLGSQIFGAAGTNTDLKKFGNTAGDEFYVGTNAAMRIQRSAGSSEAFGTQINGDTARRVLINSSGVISFGDGSATQDTNLYRSAANILKTDDSMVAATFRTTTGIVNDNSSVNAYIKTLTTGTEIERNIADANPALIVEQLHASSTGDILQLSNSGGVKSKFTQNGVFFPVQAPTASAPTYVIGGVYFDTTLNKLRVGGAAGWETITSV